MLFIHTSNYDVSSLHSFWHHNLVFSGAFESLGVFIWVHDIVIIQEKTYPRLTPLSSTRQYLRYIFISAMLLQTDCINIRNLLRKKKIYKFNSLCESNVMLLPQLSGLFKSHFCFSGLMLNIKRESAMISFIIFHILNF